jgi:hypothetical protein
MCQISQSKSVVTTINLKIYELCKIRFSVNRGVFKKAMLSILGSVWSDRLSEKAY